MKFDVLHSRMPHDSIQGQGQGHENLTLINTSIFKVSSASCNGSWQMT